MNEFFNCLFTNNGMAFGTGSIIFLVTLILVARRIIGFTLSFLFLLFALTASYSVAHQETVRSYFTGTAKTGSQKGSYQAQGAQKEASYVEQAQKIYEELKTDLEELKEKVQQYFENQSAAKKEPQKNQENQPSSTQNKSP